MLVKAAAGIARPGLGHEAFSAESIGGKDSWALVTHLLRRAGRKQLLLVDHADHNGPTLVAGPEVIDAVVRFITNAPTR